MNLAMLSYLGAAVGPKQAACLASGGSWQGPTGKKKCVAGAGTAIVATGGALPKPGSTVTGPIPQAYVGTEKKGAPGPKQVACQAQGGHWIGPEGKRWCQLVPGAPVPTTGPVSTATVPPGAEAEALPTTQGAQVPAPEAAISSPGVIPTSGAVTPDQLATAGSAVYAPSSWFEQNQMMLLGLAAVGVVGYMLYRRGAKPGRRTRVPGARRARPKARVSRARAAVKR